MKQDLVKRIKEYFGLNIYETKVWLALLSKGIASAGEIAEISGVPRSRTYDVLESLEKRGFAIVKIGKPVRYISVKPTEVIEKIKSRALNDAKERVDSLSSLKDTQEYTELEELHNTGISPIKSAPCLPSTVATAAVVTANRAGKTVLHFRCSDSSRRRIMNIWSRKLAAAGSFPPRPIKVCCS